jgi:hypothetical protein
LNYAKSSRAKSALVWNDLQNGVSLDNIKEATSRSIYPEANPFGDLIRTKEKVDLLFKEAEYAYDKNSELLAEAEDRLSKTAAQYMFEGGNFGEMSHTFAQIQPEFVKEALASMLPYLEIHGLDITKSKVAAIRYEMDNTNKQRVVNPDNTLAQAYATFCKIAEGQDVLREGYLKLKEAHEEVTKTLSDVMVRNASQKQ